MIADRKVEVVFRVVDCIWLWKQHKLDIYNLPTQVKPAADGKPAEILMPMPERWELLLTLLAAGIRHDQKLEVDELAAQFPAGVDTWAAIDKPVSEALKKVFAQATPAATLPTE